MGNQPSEIEFQKFKKLSNELDNQTNLIKDKDNSKEVRLYALKEAVNLIDQMLNLPSLPLTKRNIYTNIQNKLKDDIQFITFKTLSNELENKIPLIKDETNPTEVRLVAINEAVNLINQMFNLPSLPRTERNFFTDMKKKIEGERDKILSIELTKKAITEQQNAEIMNSGIIDVYEDEFDSEDDNDDMELQIEIEKDIGMISLSNGNKYLTVLDTDNNQLYTVKLYKQADLDEIVREIRDNKLSTLDDFIKHTIRKIFNFTIPKNDPNFVHNVEQIEKKYKNNFKELSADERGLRILDMIRSDYIKAIDTIDEPIDKLNKTIDEFSKTKDAYSKTIDSIDEINYYISLLRENYVSDTRISTCNMLFICLLHFILMVLILSVIVRLIMNKC